MAAQASLYSRSFCKLVSSTRYFSSNNVKKGLVIGCYTNVENRDDIVLTGAAEKYNVQSSGLLMRQLMKAGKNMKKGDTRLLYCLDEEYLAVCVVGLGTRPQGYNEIENIDETREAARIASGVGAKTLQSVGVSDIAVEEFDDAEAAAEGANLAVWNFQQFKNEKQRKSEVNVTSYGQVNEDNWKSGYIKAEAQNVARRLMEMPSNILTPQKFADEARTLLRPLGNVQVDARDKSWVEAQDMGAFLSVAQGSAQPPVFLELTYSGAGQDIAPIGLVGKGVTFDSGGICIKAATNMDEMRGDMGGGACVLSSIFASAKYKLPLNIKGFIPLCENMPSSRATRPGDVVRAMNGKTIQIDDTDSEGRLLLADALCYSQKFNPSLTVDVATLTGEMRIALGEGATGVFSNSNEMWQLIHAASVHTGDRVWRFPLWEMYSKNITEFPSVDINNIGKEKVGGSCTAAAFLREFVERGKWMHLDIASVMSSSKDTPYQQKGFTGRPTRTIIQFLRELVAF